MADNFDMKKFLTENKLGAYSRLKENKFYAPDYVAKKYGDKAKEIEANIEDEEDNNPNIWDLYTSLETADEVDNFVKGFMNENKSSSIKVSRDLYYFDKLNALAAKDEVDEKYHKHGTLWAKKGDTIKSDSEEYDMIIKSKRLKKGKDYTNESLEEDVNVRPFDYGKELPTKTYAPYQVKMQDIIDFVKKYPGITMKELALKAYGNYRGGDSAKIFQGAIYMIDRAVQKGAIIKVKDIKVGKSVFTFFTPEDYEEFLQKKKSMNIGKITMKEDDLPIEDTRVKQIIQMLKDLDVDGETMEFILKQVGMSDQMANQLVHNKVQESVTYNSFMRVDRLEEIISNLKRNVSTNSNIPTVDKEGLLQAFSEMEDLLEDLGADIENEMDDRAPYGSNTNEI